MLALVTLAHAHPSALPHVHGTDPAAVAVIGFWVLAAAAFVTVVRRFVPAG